MVIISNGRKLYEYKNKKNEVNIIDKTIRDDFARLCKEKKIVKSKLIEEFYKRILLRFREGNLNETNSYITINVLDSSVRKSK